MNFLKFAGLCVVLLASTSFPVNADTPTHAFEGVHVIPMTSEVVLHDQTVVIKNGRVKAICARHERCVPDGARSIEAGGQYLMPGLTDMHAHVDGLGSVGSNASAEQIEVAVRTRNQQLRQYLVFGVTTIRDTAGGPSNLRARSQIESGALTGPRLFTAFVSMDGDPPLHSATTPFSSPAEAAEFVRKTAADGYDMVKIYSTLPRETFDAIMTTASEVGIPVGGHVPMPVDFEYALKSGMRSVEHLSGFDMACAGPDAGLEPVMDDVYQGWGWCTPEKIQSLARMAAGYPVWHDPTLIVVEGVKTEFDRYAVNNEDDLRYTPPRLAAFFPYLYEIFSPRTRTGLKGSRNVRLALAKSLADSGAHLLLGTDTMASGFNVHQELALMAEAGLTPYQALTSGTSEPARYFGREGAFGTIVPGASADLILLDANPLEDVVNASKISGVMFRGTWWPRDRLDAEIGALQAEYAEDRLELGSE